jgi:hypothetical protein
MCAQAGSEEDHPVIALRRAVEGVMTCVDRAEDGSVSPVSSMAVVSGGTSVQR